jgi:hypothetical protein
MRKRNKEVLAVSESELNRMVKDLDEMHNDISVPALKELVESYSEELRERKNKLPRRSFLIGSGALLGTGALLAACSSSAKNQSTTVKPSKNYPASLTGDLAIVALAASLENLGVYAYNAGIQAATAGKLGTVPPAVVTFAKTAMNQHQQHAVTWNAILSGASYPKVTETDPVLTPVVNSKFAQVHDVGSLANLALEIENIAAQTYQVATTAVTSSQGVRVAAGIQPVEMQHAAILNFVLGNYPVPDAFSPTSQARSVSDLQ